MEDARGGFDHGNVVELQWPVDQSKNEAKNFCSVTYDKEIARDRFLKVNETLTRGYSRFQLLIPADGMEEFNLHLRELIEEYDDGEIKEATAAPKRNQEGRYITVTEIKGNFRNTILILENGWDDFGGVLDDYAKQCKFDEVQDRFEVDISELPDETDLST